MKKIIITTILAACSNAMWAQMDNVVEVENQFTPTVKDANKVNVLPLTVTTQVKHYDVQYSTEARPTDNITFQPADPSLSDAAVKGAPKNFFTLAGGNLGNLLGRGAFGWEITDRDILHFDLSLRGHNGEVESFENRDKEWKQRFYQTNADVRYEHLIAPSSAFYVRGGMDSQVYNYQHVGPTSTTDKQHNWIGCAEVGVTPYTTGKFTVGASAMARVFSRNNYLNNEYYGGIQMGDDQNVETRFDADVITNFQFNSQHSAGLDLKGAFARYDLKSYENQGAFHLVPHYAFQNEKVDIRLGARMIFESGLTKKFRVTPDAHVIFHLSPSADFFAEAKGGLHFNDFFRMNSITPYWNLPFEQLKSQFDQLQANAGFRWKIREGWHAAVSAGYDITEDRTELQSPSGELWRNGVFTAKGSLVHIDAHTKYSYKDIVTLEARGRFNGWNIDDENGYFEDTPAWRPIFEAEASAIYQPVSGLRIGVDFQFASFPSDNYVLYERPTMSNLGASISYKIPRELIPANLSIYCKADNLLNQKYDAYYGHQSIGTSFLAGFALSF